MAIKFEKIEPGMELMDVHRVRIGNTTMSQWGLWYVRIVSVDREAMTAVVRWNGNLPQTWRRRQLERLYTNKPAHYRRQEEARNARRGGGL